MKKTLAIMLAMVMLFALAVPVMAASSPAAGKKLTVVVIDTPGAKPETNGVTVSEDIYDGTMTLTLTAEETHDGKEFVSWSIYRRDGSEAVIDVDYKLVMRATVTSLSFKIIPLTDLIIAANYGDAKTDVKDAIAVFQDKSEPTGDVVVAFSVVMMAALAGTVVCKKQLAK